jgi:hypothetical protein
VTLTGRRHEPGGVRGRAGLSRRARRTIVHEMSALALALHLVLAAPGSGLPPGLAPRLDPGPFQGGELVASSLGVLVGDALVVGGAYGALQLFANGTIRPSADNFRTMAYAAGVAALVVPPLTAVLLARLFRAEPASGALWKAMLLAVAGQGAALAVGYYSAPRFWLVAPAQLLAVGAGTTLGLHWGGGRSEPAPAAAPETRREPGDPPPAAASARARLCPDPALATAG